MKRFLMLFKYLNKRWIIVITIMIVGLLITASLLFLLHLYDGQCQEITSIEQTTQCIQLPISTDSDEHIKNSSNFHELAYFFIAILGLICTCAAALLFSKIDKKRQDLKQLYLDLKLSQEQMIHCEKLTSLGQMVASVAHEMNTPLGFIMNNIEIIGDYIEQIQTDNTRSNLHLYTDHEHKEIEELLKDSRSGLKDISQLVTSLNDFSRLDKQEKQWFNIHHCIESTLKISNSIIKKNHIKVEKNFCKLPQVQGIPSKINQVFLNIITNACQAMNKGGTLDINTNIEDESVIIAFKDTGQGMNAETKKYIFTPFYTTKSAGSGTGLGMSVSFNIIEEHYGKIKVHSTENQGSTITIVLPIKQPC